MNGSRKTQSDTRVLRTRRLIRDAFIDLLQETELDKISVNRIAERAAINRVTFYLHYRDIPDLMDKLADEMIEGIEEAMKGPSPRSPSSGHDVLPSLERLLEPVPRPRTDIFKLATCIVCRSVLLLS